MTADRNAEQAAARKRSLPPCPRRHVQPDYAFQFGLPLPFLTRLGLDFDEQVLVLRHRDHVKSDREFRCHAYNGFTFHFCHQHPHVVV